MSTDDSNSRLIIEDALSNFRSLVAADGGEIHFNTYTDDSTVNIDYKMGTNDECHELRFIVRVRAHLHWSIGPRGLPIGSIFFR